MNNIYISGFADEISSDFKQQLDVVTSLGMEYISLRSADGKGIADYTAAEVKEQLVPQLEAHKVKVSSLGSPIGKIDAEDEEAFAKQMLQLEELCRIGKLLDCGYIRMFSFYIPKGKDPARYRDIVIEKLKKFEAVARKHNIVLIHENEKDIYGDTKERCKDILDTVGSPYFKTAFDFANFVQCKEDPMVCYDMLREHIVYIHIKDAVSTDNENVLCGTGEGKIKEILTLAIARDGYKGFLTLEPHLVLFDTLQSLEVEDAANIIKENKAKDGADGYKMQYQALLDILETIR